METNKLNIKCLNIMMLIVLSNTYAIFEGHFMKMLSNTEAELKKKCIKKACTVFKAQPAFICSNSAVSTEE